jgi:hypothetical protein
MSERSKEMRLEEHKADNKLETRNVRHQSCGSVDAVRTIYRGLVRLDRPCSGATSYSLETAHRGPSALILNKSMICESRTKAIAEKNPVDRGINDCPALPCTNLSVEEMSLSSQQHPVVTDRSTIADTYSTSRCSRDCLTWASSHLRWSFEQIIILQRIQSSVHICRSESRNAAAQLSSRTEKNPLELAPTNLGT